MAFLELYRDKLRHNHRFLSKLFKENGIEWGIVTKLLCGNETFIKEMVADHLGHVGEFYTLTTPSRMHACLHNGASNPRHDGTTTLQAHEYLTHLWGRRGRRRRLGS